jgi:hypothetical protein
MRILPALALAVALSGCATPQIIKSNIPFDKAQAEALLRPGTNTIKGSALIKQNMGTTVTCAGNEVSLIPATRHAEDRLTQIYGSPQKGFRQARGYNADNANPDYLKLIKISTCNAQGFFTFSNVADGDFFITTAVVWRTNPYFLDGGSLMQRVQISGGKEVEIVLAP